MSNILKFNEHQECLKTAKMGYFPMKMHDFPSIFVKSYYQHHIIMEWDVPHLQHIQLLCSGVRNLFIMSLSINITSSREG